MKKVTAAITKLEIVQTVLRTNNPLFQYAPNVGVYHCPGDVRFKLPTLAAGWSYDSYSKSQNAGGESYNNFWGAGATYLKLSQMQAPSLTFIFMEDAGNNGSGGYNLGTWTLTWVLGSPQSFKWVDPLPMYHGSINTEGFADGHAEFHKWVGANTVQYGKRAASGQNVANWPGPLTGPDYDYVYQGYRHPNWR